MRLAAALLLVTVTATTAEGEPIFRPSQLSTGQVEIIARRSVDFSWTFNSQGAMVVHVEALAPVSFRVTAFRRRPNGSKGKQLTPSPSETHSLCWSGLASYDIELWPVEGERFRPSDFPVIEEIE